MGTITDALFGAVCARCNTTRTHSRLYEVPTCPACEKTVLEAKAKAEEKRPCPMDGTAMHKEVVHKLVIDRCSKCGGVWLDPEELEAIKNTVRQEGVGQGMAMGMAAS